MSNEELLAAISDIIDKKFDEKFDEKLQPLYTRLDILELKQDRTMKKLNDFQLDMKIAERHPYVFHIRTYIRYHNHSPGQNDKAC